VDNDAANTINDEDYKNNSVQILTMREKGQNYKGIMSNLQVTITQ